MIVDQMELNQITSYLRLFHQRHLSNYLIHSQIIDYFQQNGLSKILLKIQDYFGYKKYCEYIGRFIRSHLQNLFTFFLFDSYISIQHFSLLFDILASACYTANNDEAHQFLYNMEEQINKLQQAEGLLNLNHTYLRIAFILLCIKLEEKIKIKNREILLGILNQYCSNIQKNTILSKFALSLVEKIAFNGQINFDFLREKVRRKKSKTVVKMAIIEREERIQKQQDQQRIEVETHHSLQAIEQQSLLSISQPSNLQGTLDWLVIKQSCCQRQQLEQKINRIKEVSVSNLKQMANYKLLTQKILYLSFQFEQLVNYAIQTSIVVFSNKEFIELAHKMFIQLKERNANQCFELYKKKFRKTLIKYCGIEAQYIWAKINN